MKPNQSLTCSSCDIPLAGNYCSNCGREKKLKRIDKTYILNEITSVLNFDKGFLYTIKELTIRPGVAVRAFILNDRKKLVKPIVFIIVCSLFFTICQQLFNFNNGYSGYTSTEKNTTLLLFNWISSNYGYANILMAFLIAAFLKLFFRRKRFNYFEILILLCFVMGMGMLFFSLFGIIESLVSLPVINKGFLIGFIYIIWAIGNFFDGKRWLNYLKSFFSYFLGMIGFFMIILLLGTLIDLVF